MRETNSSGGYHRRRQRKAPRVVLVVTLVDIHGDVVGAVYQAPV